MIVGFHKKSSIITSMVESVDPGLAVRLGSFDGPNIMRFAVIIPSQHLDDVELTSVGDDRLPTLCVKMLVGEEDPLVNQYVSRKKNVTAVEG